MEPEKKWKLCRVILRGIIHPIVVEILLPSYGSLFISTRCYCDRTQSEVVAVININTYTVIQTVTDTWVVRLLAKKVIPWHFGVCASFSCWGLKMKMKAMPALSECYSCFVFVFCTTITYCCCSDEFSLQRRMKHSVTCHLFWAIQFSVSLFRRMYGSDIAFCYLDFLINCPNPLP